MIVTSSPTLNFILLLPIKSIIPEPSLPNLDGKFGFETYLPSLYITSP